MPVVNKAQIERMASRCGVDLNKKYTAMMEKYGDNAEAIRDAGIAYAIDQIVDLVSQGVDGIHLYTMNNPFVAKKITQAVESLF
jgi:methylenetetrahydrofolate reductase (NADPH)